MNNDVSSDWETDTDQQTTVAAPLRRPHTLPRVLTCGRGKSPLANLTSVAKGHRNNDGHGISDAPPSINNQDMERNSSVMAPIKRQQTYPAAPPLANLEKN